MCNSPTCQIYGVRHAPSPGPVGCTSHDTPRHTLRDTPAVQRSGLPAAMAFVPYGLVLVQVQVQHSRRHARHRTRRMAHLLLVLVNLKLKLLNRINLNLLYICVCCRVIIGCRYLTERLNPKFYGMLLWLNEGPDHTGGTGFRCARTAPVRNAKEIKAVGKATMPIRAAPTTYHRII
jgi:hypothetical protein